MTLLDLCRLARHYWYIVVLVTIACVLGCAAYVFYGGQTSNYSASSYIVAGSSSQLSTLNGTAASASREFETGNQGYTAKAQADNASLTITITVTGQAAETCVSGANSISNDATKAAEQLVDKNAISAKTEEAVSATPVSKVSPSSYFAIAFVAGVFVALCIVAGIGAVRRPIKTAADLAEASGQPILGEMPQNSLDFIFANIQFASDVQPNVVCLVPVSNASPVGIVAKLLNRESGSANQSRDTARGGAIRFEAVPPLSQSIGAVYTSRSATATVIIAAQWKDTYRDVESTVTELALARSNVVGCVFAKRAKAHAQKA